MLKRCKKRRGNALLWVNALALALLLLFPAGAMGASITLSQYSSEAFPAADALDATLDFSVSVIDSTWTLKLKVTNESAYYINEIYFNATSNVTDLTLSPLTGWELLTEATSKKTKADGFGRFDYFLDNGSGEDPDAVAPWPSDDKVFVFSISGTGSYSDTDFISKLTTVEDDGIPAIVAAKFVAGDESESAYGASIPIPASVLLLGSGLIVLLGLRRRSGR